MHNVSLREAGSKSFKPAGPLPFAEEYMGTQGLRRWGQGGHTDWLSKTTFLRGQKKTRCPNLKGAALQRDRDSQMTRGETQVGKRRQILPFLPCV